MPRWIAYRRLHRTKQDREPKWTQEKTERTEKNKTVFKIPGWRKIEKGQKEKNVWRIEVACKINKNCAGENMGRRLFKCVKDNSSKDLTFYLFKHLLERKHKMVALDDFKIIRKCYKCQSLNVNYLNCYVLKKTLFLFIKNSVL